MSFVLLLLRSCEILWGIFSSLLFFNDYRGGWRFDMDKWSTART